MTLQRIEPRVRERVELLARDLAAERPDAALDLAESLSNASILASTSFRCAACLQEQVLPKRSGGKLADFDRGRCLGWPPYRPWSMASGSGRAVGRRRCSRSAAKDEHESGDVGRKGAVAHREKILMAGRSLQQPPPRQRAGDRRRPARWRTTPETHDAFSGTLAKQRARQSDGVYASGKPRRHGMHDGGQLVGRERTPATAASAHRRDEKRKWYMKKS